LRQYIHYSLEVLMKNKEVNSPALPDWIRPAFRKRPYLEQLAPRLRALGVSTVCESARCPNLGECFSCGEATFLLMGEVCTRNCHFCAVTPGQPAPLDPEEPMRVANAAKELGLKHIVLTCVTRDDLADGGAAHLAAAICALREVLPSAAVEVLTSDFRGTADSVRTVMAAAPDVFAHNVECVPRLYADVRPQADWQRSLEILRFARSLSDTVLIKSGLMVGLGETRAELLDAFQQIRDTGTDLLTVGQYLQPTPEHFPVVEYLKLEAYQELKAAALAMGFRHVAAAPLVRSSYRAADAVQ
jgi:lipoyl synthase